MPRNDDPRPARPVIDREADAANLFDSLLPREDLGAVAARPAAQPRPRPHGHGAREQQAPMPGGRHATAARTRAAAAAGIGRIERNEEADAMFGHLANLQAEDEITDEEAARRAGVDNVLGEAEVHRLADGQEAPRRIGGPGNPVPTIDNLPAIINRQIALHDPNLAPEWHQVRHLPGYLANPIRALGRSVFRQFTATELEKIQIVCTATNPETEVRGLVGWIMRNGVRDETVEMDFTPSIPGYKPDVQVWKTEDYTFLCVRDFMGHYVYGWAGGRGTRLEADPEAPRLGFGR